ncbi:putative membrane protein DUF2339 [Aneurinibacillus soli]|uniref:Uncharacterized protein n=1 Tax=Aneurinibacillus soli TaxID=1500254 RepID=A0A0U4WKN6_9BACL|nr:DUF2339 domain-containing protein [Aneurinibacillus soli]PYE62910.1 putative membrane protein DUF2339 [Aneurinibacillus soli]BAU29032.1 hypothetical protein CB4_03210 [Aneurinibacillus soli]
MNQEQRIAELEAQVAELTRRLEAVESKERMKHDFTHKKQREEIVSILPPPEKEPVDWETLLGRVWLPRVFVMVLLIGIVWAFKASIDRGYLTESVRVALGFILAGAFVFLGRRQMVRKHAALGQVLLSGAVCASVLSTFAMHMLYGFIPAVPAFVLNVMWIAGGVWLSLRYESQALAVLSSLAGVLIPFLVESKEPSALFFTAYEVVLYVTFLYVAIKKQYSTLYYSSAILLQLVLTIFWIISDVEGAHVLALGSMVQHVCLLIFMIRSPRCSLSYYGMLLATFGLTTRWMKIGLSDLEVEGALLAFTVGYAVLAYQQYGRSKEKAAVAASIASFALTAYIMEAWDAESESLLLILDGTLALYVAVMLQSKWQRITGILIYLFGTWVIVWEPINELFSLEMLSWLVLLGTGAWLYRLYRRDVPVFVGRVVQVAGLMYAGLLLLFVTEVTDVVMRDFTYEIQRLAVSGVWALYAVAGLVYGARKEKQDIRRLGLALLIVTLLKAVFLDVPSLSLLVRAVLFIGLGAVGLLMSRLFYSSASEKKE